MLLDAVAMEDPLEGSILFVPLLLEVVGWVGEGENCVPDWVGFVCWEEEKILEELETEFEEICWFFVGMTVRLGWGWFPVDGWVCKYKPKDE